MHSPAAIPTTSIRCGSGCKFTATTRSAAPRWRDDGASSAAVQPITATLACRRSVLWRRCSFSLEHRPQELLQGRAGRHRRGLVITGMGIDPYAGILVRERLSGFGIDDDTERLL